MSLAEVVVTTGGALSIWQLGTSCVDEMVLSGCLRAWSFDVHGRW